MRLQQSVDLGAGRSVTVSELRVRDARNLLAQAKLLEQQNIASLLTDRFDEMVRLLGDCVQFPAGETLDDLGFSEVELVKDALLEVNSAFLDLLGLAGWLPATQQASLTGPASA
jgi:hypothetical protein